MKALLGIDNGGTFTKAALFSETGEQICSTRVSIPLLTPESGFTERNLSELRAANFEAIRTCIRKSGLDPSVIAAVGLSGHGKGLYLLDREKRPLANGIVSTDSRAVGIAERFEREGVCRNVFEKTFQRVLPCQPVCLLRWMKENRPDVYGRIGSILSVNDYIRFCLTGNVAAELSCLSGTNLYNLRDLRYDPELLVRFGIEEMADCLPPVIGSDETAGGICREAARETGLLEGTAVGGGMFDIDACGLAIGLTDERIIASVTGTWTINEYLSRTPVLDGSVQMNSLYCLKDYFLVEECSPTGAGNLEWLMNSVLGEHDYAELDRRIAELSPAADLYFLPFVFGSNENPKAKGTFVGLTSFHGRDHIARAVYEGVAFSCRRHIEKLVRAKGGADAIRFAGGAAKSGVWMQIFADVLQIPVEVSKIEEPGALGAARLAGIACGLIRDTAVPFGRRSVETVFPNPETAEIFERKFRTYRKIIEALDCVWNDVDGGEKD